MLHSVIRLHVLKKKVIGVLLLAAFFTSGCATSDNVTKLEESALKEKIKTPKNRSWSLAFIESELSRLNDEGQIADKIVQQNLVEAARILYLANESSVSSAIVLLSQEQPERTSDFIQIGLTLFPKQSEEIIEKLRISSTVDEEAVVTAALQAGISVNRILRRTAAGEDVSVVPLINSASITIYNQKQEYIGLVRFRETDGGEWTEAMPLYWEPIREALSGSIVHLLADTAYEVKIIIKSDTTNVETRNFTFKTRPNSPPVNPDLVYNLNDIYSGGQLNLSELGISGTKDGWAKIIGDDATIIVAREDNDYAIDIGNAKYVMFENITVKGGRRHGIYGKYAHHIWFKNCDISKWGRKADYYVEGIGYEGKNSHEAINYDAGISLVQSGTVVVENCTIHSPNGGANHWGYGHPKGPSAMLILAAHPNKEYSGQYIIRNNNFSGTSTNRFNDVIESRSNGRVWGGFARDSAIHDNYFAYANDDIIELDGGQSNVLFYNNELEQGFCGVSAIPNMLGPSFVFNNYIHNLGDERQKHWGAFKLGGLLSRPAGIVNIFNNLVVSDANGIAPAGFAGDSTYWVHAQNNIFIHSTYRDYMGYSIHDPNKYPDSQYVNNYMFNIAAGFSVFNADITRQFHDLSFVNSETASDIASGARYYFLSTPIEFMLPNFTVISEANKSVVGIIPIGNTK